MKEWRALASCIDLAPETHALFFGEGHGPVSKQHEKARRICYSCPVQIECLYEAVTHDERYYVWGGLTESQRKRYVAPRVRREGLSYGLLTEVVIQQGAGFLQESVPSAFELLRQRSA